MFYYTMKDKNGIEITYVKSWCGVETRSEKGKDYAIKMHKAKMKKLGLNTK